MSSSSFVSATLSSTERLELPLQVLTKTEPVTSLAKEHQVSRKFLYQQSNRANDALDEAFATSTNDVAEISQQLNTPLFLVRQMVRFSVNSQHRKRTGGVGALCTRYWVGSSFSSIKQSRMR